MELGSVRIRGNIGIGDEALGRRGADEIIPVTRRHDSRSAEPGPGSLRRPPTTSGEPESSRSSPSRAGDRVVVAGGNGLGKPLAPAARKRFGGVLLDAETGSSAMPVVFGDVDLARLTTIRAATAEVARFEILAPGRLPGTDEAVDVWLVAVRLP